MGIVIGLSTLKEDPNTYPSLVTSSIKNQINTQEKEERLLHLLQFLSFIKSLA